MQSLRIEYNPPDSIVGSTEKTPLTFVDVIDHGPVPTGSAERLTTCFQENSHLLLGDRVLIRWPWLAGPDDAGDGDVIVGWLQRLQDGSGSERIFPADVVVQVVQHRIGSRASVFDPAGEVDYDDRTLAHARAVEVHNLLTSSNAIWRPPSYHYRLPNGEHVDTFVRLADAFRSPRDVFALSSWLTERLVDGIGVVADTASMTPVLLQLETFLERFDWKLGPVSILEAYPSSRAMVHRHVERAMNEFATRLIGLQSVSSSGGLRRTFADELAAVAEQYGLAWSLDVIVDRGRDGAACEQLEPSGDNEREITWLGLDDARSIQPSGVCELCKTSDKAQYVAIDPRTYGEMALPAPLRVMPNTLHANASQSFWERVALLRGVAVDAKPFPHSKVASAKRVLLPVRPFFEVLVQSEGLAEFVGARCRSLPERDQLATAGLVVATSWDLDETSLPAAASGSVVDLEASLRILLNELGVPADVRIVNDDDQEALINEVQRLPEGRSVLVFSWASVTGLTLRRLKLAVADVLEPAGKIATPLNGLVLHAKPTTPSEWSATQNQFRGSGSLATLWISHFPWESPLSEEFQLLDTTDLDASGLNDEGRRFLATRREFLDYRFRYLDRDDDWSARFEAADAGGPDPTHIFWGMSSSNLHQQHVRGRSLYGQGLDCLTAYAAIGSTIQYTRLTEESKAAPRWVMFDLGRLVRSYFDAIILVSALRWLRPGELWWGSHHDSPEAHRDSVAFLVDQASGVDEQVLLMPELLLAASLGKVPATAIDLVCESARRASEGWIGDDYAMARGAVSVGLALIDSQLPRFRRPTELDLVVEQSDEVVRD